MIEKITVEELKQMQEKEGIVFQGCGGELQEWEDGVNELLTESGILLDGDTFKNVYAFENVFCSFVPYFFTPPLKAPAP